MNHQILFIGSKQLGLKILKLMYDLAPDQLIAVITFNDEQDTRSQLVAFQKFSYTSGVPLHIAQNRKESEEIIKNLQPNICFVVGWYWLIDNDLVDAIPNGMIGLHNSLLPKYRGGAPLIWSILNNDTKTGVTLFTLGKGMDDGAIWGQKSFSIESTDYISDILLKLENASEALIKDLFLHIIQGKVRPQEQNSSSATFGALRKQEDGFIDWNRSAQYIYNFIRAQSTPYPGAFSFLKSMKMIIWRAEMIDMEFHGTPGQVGLIKNDDIYIICGDNRPIILKHIEVGEKEGSAGSFVKSIKERLPSYE